MRTLLISLCAAALLLSLPTVASAADPSRVRYAELTGTITALDLETGAMTVAGEFGPIHFKFHDDVRVLVNGDPAKRSDLALASRVRITYRSEGEQPYLAELVIDQTSFRVVADEFHGMAATIDAIGPAPHDDSTARALSLTLANGRKRDIGVTLVSVLLLDGQRVRLDAFHVGQSVWVQIHQTVRGARAKAMADQPSFDAYLSEHTVMATVVQVLDQRDLILNYDGLQIRCRTRPDALLINEGIVTNLLGFRRGQQVFVKYVDIVDDAWVVAGVFTSDCWRQFATAWADKAVAAPH